MRPLFTAIFPFLTVFTLVASGGCRKSVAPLCRQICVCKPCTPTDFDACVSKAEAAQQSAEKSGCTDAFDALVGCVEDNLSCRADAGLGTGKCVRADIAVVQCDGTGNPFTSLCDNADVKGAACTGVVFDPATQPPNDCLGVNLCTAKCELAQPCSVLTGNAAARQPLDDCVNACQMKNEPPPPSP